MNTDKAEKVLIIRMSSLGDLVHSLPALHALKRGINCEISFITNSEYADFVKCFSDVNRVISFNRKNFIRGLVELYHNIKKEHFDLVIDLQGLLKSAIILYLAVSPRKIGPSYHRELSHIFYHEISGRRDMNRHAVERTFDVVKYLGIDYDRREFNLTFPPARYEIPRDRRNIAIIGDARWQSKIWPYEYFVRLASLLIRDGFNVYLLGSSEGWKNAAASLLDGGANNLIGKTNLVELGSLLRDMDLVVSNDSGPMHIAAALGVRVVALMGPTDPVRTGPYGEGHIVFSGRASCAPCFRRSCPDNVCMKKISPDEVYKAVIEMI